MKTHQLSEVLILEMHKDPKWSERIERELPELFTVKIGRWYDYNSWTLLVAGFRHDGVIMACGFDHNGEWHDESPCGNSPKEWKSKDPEEVRDAFKQELVRRYGQDWQNVKIKAHADGDHCNNLGDCHSVIDIEDCQVFNKNGLLFNNGQWAEPINVMTKEEAEKKFNIVIR